MELAKIFPRLEFIVTLVRLGSLNLAKLFEANLKTSIAPDTFQIGLVLLTLQNRFLNRTDL